MGRLLVGVPGFFGLELFSTANWLRAEAKQLHPKGMGCRLAAVSIILSCASVESYVNEAIKRKFEEMSVAERGAFEYETLSRRVVKREKAILRLKLAEKLGRLTKQLTGKQFPMEKTVWREFREKWQKRTRNRLVHYTLERLSNQEAKQAAQWRIRLWFGLF